MLSVRLMLQAMAVTSGSFDLHPRCRLLTTIAVHWPSGERPELGRPPPVPDRGRYRRKTRHSSRLIIGGKAAFQSHRQGGL